MKCQQALVYNELDTTGVKKQYEKTIDFLKADNFQSAEVKKLTGTEYYRAKLDYTNRLLFKLVKHRDKRYALILEIIHNHAYEKSRFLNKVKFDENQIEFINAETIVKHDELAEHYINSNNNKFHFLDKIISFDPVQENIFQFEMPLIIIGSAGSGKTMLTLEKMKCCPGEVLYITGSPYLIHNARQLYYSNQYSNQNQEIDFLSYSEYLETIKVPQYKEIRFNEFAAWFLTIKTRTITDTNKLYEEFKGVLTGNSVTQNYLSRADYLQLGVKQSIYGIDERDQVYTLFEKYLSYLGTCQFYDINLLSFEYLNIAVTKYDYIVVDEVQDFTAVQLALIFKSLKFKQNFMLCGDSNQVVHPNFFSWSKIKTLFYNQPENRNNDIIQILHKNYRNALSVTTLANKILKAKNARFGSIDKESHYLVECGSCQPGEVYCLIDSVEIRREINQKTRKSTQVAIIVLRDELKAEAIQHFQTPLVFSIHEAKGLEYDNVILYKLISSEQHSFAELANGVCKQNLEGDFTYSRVKNKADRSLEIFKFFINALYVAITRAIKNVYLIESIDTHPFLQLLSLSPSAEIIALELQESATEEWQKEAQRLEMQGKQEQADAIRSSILQTKQVPWTVITTEYYATLRFKSLDNNKKDKDARLLLFEYAANYNLKHIIKLLGNIGFNAALKPINYSLLERKYFMGFSSPNNINGALRQIDTYGVDFRNIFNQTPLMIATIYENLPLIRELIKLGANRDLTDNFGRNSFQLLLSKISTTNNLSSEKIEELYDCLVPDAINLNVNEKLVKIDAQRMEFILINMMIALINVKQHGDLTFKVDDFLLSLESFPSSIIPDKRKRRAYISSILAKHEISRDDIYNKQLFKRVQRGYYIFNTQVLLKLNNNWVNLSNINHTSVNLAAKDSNRRS